MVVSTQVRSELDGVLVTVGALPDDRIVPLLGRHVRSAAANGRVIIDLSEVVLRPDDVRVVSVLIDQVDDCDVWVCCSRLAGRQMLRRFLGRPCNVVRSPEDVPRQPVTMPSLPA